MSKANKNQQDIFHLQLFQRNSKIFALIDFNRSDRPAGEVKITTADDGSAVLGSPQDYTASLKALIALFVSTYSQSIGIKISFQ